MEEPVSGWVTILGLLPFVAGAGLLWLLLLARRWKANAWESLDNLRADLRAFQTQLREIQQVGQTFSAEDPEPYGELVEQVAQGVKQCELRLHDIYQRYGELHKRANLCERQDGWRSLLSALEWNRLEGEALILQADLEAAQGEIDVPAQPADRLRRLGWEMASHSREILQKAQAAGSMFAELSQQALIEDAALDSAWQDACEWEETLLAQVPVVYYQDDEPAVLSRTDKDMTAHVYRVIKTARPAVEALYEKARQWQADYARLAELMKEVHRAHNQTAALYSSLQKVPRLPVTWEKTQAVMVRMGEQLDGIGAVVKKRSLQQLAVDLAALEALNSRILDTRKHVQWVSEQQGRLSTLLGTLTASQEEKWLDKAAAMAEQAKSFDPENFSGQVPAHDLAESLKKLSALWRQVLSTDPAQPVREAALPALTKNAEQAVAMQENLRSQSDLLRARFEELLQVEEELRDQLLRSRAILSQAGALIGSNPFLRRLAKNEQEGLTAQVEISLVELSEHGQGTVAAKAKKAAPILKRVEQAVARWSDTLAQEVAARKDDLENKIEVLESKVKLDEPALLDTIRLLRRVELDLAEPAPAPEQASLMAQTERLKSLNQAHQSCTISLQQVEEFAGTVLNLYQKAEKHRQAVLEHLQKAEEVAPEALNWPASTQHLSNEPAQVKALEQLWLSLRQEPLRAIQMAGKLSDLSERYQMMDTQLRRLVDTALQEQQGVLAYEKRLNDSIKMWQRQASLHANNRSVQGAVQSLVESARREHEALKLRYERGNIPYQQTLNSLKQICRKLDEASVPVDDQQDLDITGAVQRRM
ncbi:MAG: hypothetical protein MUC85_00965 [Anaerolineales bacterium]|nr:hypothetical protein [Anaerolineales bacterium]